ncbi:MAG: hypothetical protein KKH75_05745, partial [Actinobacteria bacterium]|nr:hypothetical protein [Actinomycetota bacterium]
MKNQNGARRGRRGLVVTFTAIAVVLAVAGGVSVAAAVMSAAQHDSRALPAGFSSSPRSTPAPKKKLPSPDPSPTDAVDSPIPDSTPIDAPAPAPPAPAPVSPAARSCATSTVMGVWAHYDDDLIFSNPGLQAA